MWGLEQEKALQQIQDTVQVALSLGPYDSADPMVLVVSVAGRDALWSHCESLIGESQKKPLEQGSVIICRELFSLGKIALALMLDLSGN